MLQGKREIVHLTLGCLNRVEEAGAGSGGLKLEFLEKPRAAPSPEAVPSLSSVGWEERCQQRVPLPPGALPGALRASSCLQLAKESKS